MSEEDPYRKLLHKAVLDTPEALAKIAANGVRLAGTMTISFADNVTPESWAALERERAKDPVSATDAVVQELLLAMDMGTLVEKPSARNKKRRKKKKGAGEDDEDKIPRPPNAFICFRKSMTAKGYIPSSLLNDNQTLSKVCGNAWKNLPESVKADWKAVALRVKAAHMEQFPNYKFHPAPPRSTRPKPTTVEERARRTRKKLPLTAEETLIHDAHSKFIASLVLTGKKGKALEIAYGQGITIFNQSLPPPPPSPPARTPVKESESPPPPPPAPLRLELPKLSIPVPKAVAVVERYLDRRRSSTAPPLGCQDLGVERRSSTTFAHLDSQTLRQQPLASLAVRSLALDISIDPVPEERMDLDRHSFPPPRATADLHPHPHPHSRSSALPLCHPAPPQTAVAEALFGTFVRNPFAPVAPAPIDEQPFSPSASAFSYRTSSMLSPPSTYEHSPVVARTPAALSRTVSYVDAPTPTGFASPVVEHQQSAHPPSALQQHFDTASFVTAWTAQYDRHSPPPLITRTMPEFMQTEVGRIDLETGLYTALQQSQQVFEQMDLGNSSIAPHQSLDYPPRVDDQCYAPSLRSTMAPPPIQVHHHTAFTAVGSSFDLSPTSPVFPSDPQPRFQNQYDSPLETPATPTSASSGSPFQGDFPSFVPGQHVEQAQSYAPIEGLESMQQALSPAAGLDQMQSSFGHSPPLDQSQANDQLQQFLGQALSPDPLQAHSPNPDQLQYGTVNYLSQPQFATFNIGPPVAAGFHMCPNPLAHVLSPSVQHSEPQTPFDMAPQMGSMDLSAGLSPGFDFSQHSAMSPADVLKEQAATPISPITPAPPNASATLQRPFMAWSPPAADDMAM